MPCSTCTQGRHTCSDQLTPNMTRRPDLNSIARQPDQTQTETLRLHRAGAGWNSLWDSCCTCEDSGSGAAACASRSAAAAPRRAPQPRPPHAAPPPPPPMPPPTPSRGAAPGGGVVPRRQSSPPPTPARELPICVAQRVAEERLAHLRRAQLAVAAVQDQFELLLV